MALVLKREKWRDLMGVSRFALLREPPDEEKFRTLRCSIISVAELRFV